MWDINLKPIPGTNFFQNGEQPIEDFAMLEFPEKSEFLGPNEFEMDKLNVEDVNQVIEDIEMMTDFEVPQEIDGKRINEAERLNYLLRNLDFGDKLLKMGEIDSLNDNSLAITRPILELGRTHLYPKKFV